MNGRLVRRGIALVALGLPMMAGAETTVLDAGPGPGGAADAQQVEQVGPYAWERPMTSPRLAALIGQAGRIGETGRRLEVLRELRAVLQTTMDLEFPEAVAGERDKSRTDDDRLTLYHDALGQVNIEIDFTMAVITASRDHRLPLLRAQLSAELQSQVEALLLIEGELLTAQGSLPAQQPEAGVAQERRPADPSWDDAQVHLARAHLRVLVSMAQVGRLSSELERVPRDR